MGTAGLNAEYMGRVNFSLLKMSRLILLLCITAFVAAQIPEGCVDCGVPQHPNCQFGDCTTTCGWCKAAPPQIEAGDMAKQNFRNRFKRPPPFFCRFPDQYFYIAG